MKVSVHTKKMLLTISEYVCYAVIITLLLRMLIVGIRMHEAQVERIDALEQTLAEMMEGQTDVLIGKGIEIALALQSDLEDAINAGTAQTIRRITATDSRIQRIDTVYSNLLAEQRKRTLDSLYAQSALADKAAEAAGLFSRGRYAQANALYAVIAAEQPENAEARFYQHYSLFLANRLERGNYRQIKEGLELLQRGGYSRPEIGQTLEYIRLEEATALFGGSP